MDAELAVNQILDDEGLTSNLDEPEATALVNWLVADVQRIAQQATSDEAGWKRIKARRQQARKIAKTVALFRDEGLQSASDFAQQQQLTWPATTPGSPKQALDLLLNAIKD